MPITLTRKGSYVLTDIKAVAVTDQFVRLGQTVTRCQTEEDRLDCQDRTYRQTVLSQCACAPFSLASHFAGDKEVKLNMSE